MAMKTLGWLKDVGKDKASIQQPIGLCDRF